MSVVLVRNRSTALGAFVRLGAFFLSLLLLALSAHAGQATLAWDANPDPAVAGYMVHYGLTSGVYTATADAGKTTTFTVTGLQEGKTYYYVVTAYDASRAESGYSNQASAVVPYAAPSANFSANATSGAAPLAVAFTSASTGTISAYAWNFGDGATSTAQNPSHSYAAAGTYSVSLTVTGPGGSNTQTKSSFILVAAGTPPPAAPVANFTSDKTSGNAPLTVAFTSTSTGSITSYAWNFGDTTTSTAQNPTKQYTTPGTYQVSLTVTGPGGSNTQTKSGYITVNTPPPAAPVAGFTASATTGTMPLAVTFTSASTGNITSYAWNFGDGGTSATQNPSHSYAAAGNYSVTLTVTGPGGTDTQTKTNYITVAAPTLPPTPAPVASFAADKTSGNAPLAVNFSNTSTGTIDTYLWTFGDGTTSTVQSPTHSYSAAGTYSVSLKVTGPSGTNTQAKTNYIAVAAATPAPPPTPAAPVAGFTASKTSGLAPLAVTFTSTSTGSITGYTWTFGDGGTSTSQNPTYTYATPGTYSVGLTVSGPGGSNAQKKTAYITVSASTPNPTPTPAPPPAAPVSAFTADSTSGVAPLAVNFTSAATGNISSYSWDFGDGTTSTSQNPSHTYSAAGTYSVSLTVVGPGGENTQSQANYITATAPVVAPAAGLSSGSATSGGGGGGCTIGTSTDFDPTFAVLLLAAGFYVRNRKQRSLSAEACGNG